MKPKTLSNVHVLFLCISILLQTDSFNAMAPITATITTGLSALSTTYPLASLATTIGKAVRMGAISIGSYLAHKKISRKPYKCFSPQENTDTTTHANTPYYPLSSLEQEQVQGCQIIVENHSPGCTLTIDPSIQTNVHFEQDKTNSVVDNKRYTGPYYTRTENWIKYHPFGQKIKDALVRSPYTNQGKRAYKVTNNIENCDGFKKGDYVVVDAMHHDHLEVFDKDKNWKSVANFDGSKNIQKTKQGVKESRGQLRKG